MLTKKLFETIKNLWAFDIYLCDVFDVLAILLMSVAVLLLIFPLTICFDILALPLEIISLIIYVIRKRR